MTTLSEEKMLYLDTVVSALQQEKEMDEKSFKRRAKDHWFIIRPEELDYAWTKYRKI